MEYLPGNISPRYQEEVFFSLLNDFNVCLLKKRYSETTLLDDSEFTTLSLKKGDIMVTRWFKPPSRYGDGECYTYIERIITDEKDIDIRSESILSVEFITLNSENKVLFDHVTKEHLRDKKINQIIN